MQARDKLIALLKHFGVHWSQVTRNALNVSCGFCDDSGEHCGVFYDKEEFMFSCWKCKAGGPLFQLLNAITGCTKKEYQEQLSSQFSEVYVESVSAEIARLVRGTPESAAVAAKIVEWPPKGSVPLFKFKDDALVSGFLKKRKLEVDFCIDRGCYIGLAGRYVNRFLIPVYYNKRVVAFQGRDMTGQSPNKYLTEGDVSQFLYGYDDVDLSKPVSIAEGVISSWRIDNAICSFSAALGDKQLALMCGMDPPAWILCWDMGSDGSDKYWEGSRVARKMAEFFGRDKVKYIVLPPGQDPDSMGVENMRALLKEPKEIWKNL